MLLREVGLDLAVARKAPRLTQACLKRFDDLRRGEGPLAGRFFDAESREQAALLIGREPGTATHADACREPQRPLRGSWPGLC